jgi:hypothetical protein
MGKATGTGQTVASWPRTRPVEIWNSFAGVAPFTTLKPVKKFPDRKVAVARIWEAVQVLPANVAKPATHVAPAEGKRNKGAPKGKRRHTAPAAAKDPVNVAREGSKKAEDRSDAPLPRGNAFRNHGTDGLAGAHGARLR